MNCVNRSLFDVKNFETFKWPSVDQSSTVATGTIIEKTKDSNIESTLFQV